MPHKYIINNKVIICLIGLLLTIIMVLTTYRIWEMDLSAFPGVIPNDIFGGDCMLGNILITAIKDDGLKGAFKASRLGAPIGSYLIDTPFLDVDYIIEIFVLTRIFGAAQSYYILYFLSFIFAYCSMYWVLNKYNNNYLLNSILSIAYSVTPYHFFRGMTHSTLSQCYVIPLIVLMATIMYFDKFDNSFISEKYNSNWRNRIIYILIWFFISMGNIYYVFFGLLLLSVAFMMKVISKGMVRCKGEFKALILYYVGATGGLLPKIIYSIINGPNDVAAIRDASNTDLFSLRIIQLLLPSSQSKLNFLKEINSVYSANAININENSMSTLGGVASVGFIIACGYIFYVFINKLHENKKGISTNRNTQIYLSFMILILVIYCMMGGIGTIVSYYLFSQIRCLNRVSIVICAISIIIISNEYSNIRGRVPILKKTIFRRIIAIALLAIIWIDVPYYKKGYFDETKIINDSYESFFNDVEESLDGEGNVYCIPYMDFPESSKIVNLYDYQLGYGVIYTKNIGWSYGELKGRSSYAKNIMDNSKIMSVDFLGNLMKAGYSGLYIDRNGYSDDDFTAIKDYFDRIFVEFGVEPIVSEDARLVFYNLKEIQ